MCPGYFTKLLLFLTVAFYEQAGGLAMKTSFFYFIFFIS